jgi:hypothetical protein
MGAEGREGSLEKQQHHLRVPLPAPCGHEKGMSGRWGGGEEEGDLEVRGKAPAVLLAATLFLLSSLGGRGYEARAGEEDGTS